MEFSDGTIDTPRQAEVIRINYQVNRHRDEMDCRAKEVVNAPKHLFA